ncbi:electron transfer flavoprotein-ubiquinone oxidoreductase-like protein [Hyaloraphidium curvatum]|nr:electron transfer flavoprotein-ubiquinone oxidoreductase-like protein [Hyaloraphidium curvatum]
MAAPMRLSAAACRRALLVVPAGPVPARRSAVALLASAMRPRGVCSAAPAPAPTALAPAVSPLARLPSLSQTASFSSSATVRAVEGEEEDDSSNSLNEERFVDEVDVLIIGGGPSGLSAAIKLKQLAFENGKEIRVVLLEKGSELGAHILSGAVIEPTALNELLPDWREMDSPVKTLVKKDKFWFLTQKHAIPLPHPPILNNAGKNYIVSLGNVVRWLGEKAEEVGVEVFPGFAGSEILYGEDGSVIGVATNDVGIGRDGKPKDSFARGMEFRAKVTLFAEGCHGSLTKQLIRKFGLREEGKFQTYGIGIKEVWELDPAKHDLGFVLHTTGYPLDSHTYGGSWCYHFENNMCSIGLVVGLDYTNPYMSPYKEFQRFKSHPKIRSMLEGGKVVSYGARALVEGGLQSLPKLYFPGGALIGDTAGFLNMPKIKGTHNAMKSGGSQADGSRRAPLTIVSGRFTGMLAAEATYETLFPAGSTESTPTDVPLPVVLSNYDEKFRDSWLYKELHSVRNVKPSFHNPLGLYGFFVWSALDMYFLKGRVPFTFQHPKPDHATLIPAKDAKPIDYPKPDGVVTFDILESVSRSGTGHEDDQVMHLKTNAKVHLDNYEKWGGPEGRFCPAGVYEFVDDPESTHPSGKRWQVNFSNCVHCKTCDIKDPNQDIQWTTPQGGEGPKYQLT